MNKKNVLHLMAIMMVAMLSVSFISCGSDDDDDAGSVSSDIVGTWVAHGGKRTVTYVFESNGSGKSSYYYGGSSGYWRQGEGAFTWGRKGNTVTVKGGYWADINSDGETSEGTYNETFEYNGSTLTGGRFGDANVYYKQ